MSLSYVSMNQTGMSKRLKKVFRDQQITRQTAHIWMAGLGYKYRESGKCYFSDVHERDDVVCYRLVKGKQMDVDVSDLTAKEKKIEKRSMLEVMKTKGCICTETKVHPKDDGSGIMVSVFEGRPYGFGFPGFEEIKDAVNAFRQNKNYIDLEAAQRVYHSTKKEDLITDPFICLFQYSNAEGKEGYWSYDHMVLQLEDILDVLYVAYGDKFDYLFLFDHSCGHDHMRTDALNINATSVGFGG
eukprot:15350784-Ditylum_brightwellii.AAC.1